ncbi:hypothetical protein PUN28_010983 [Cardiocondyla obscurior]|uniref:Uncharacterized protein n=1 Tax=Cardiocondyla obscurior TaxID=286306 RepID=A0AAW2FKV4_9HYME
MNQHVRNFLPGDEPHSGRFRRLTVTCIVLPSVHNSILFLSPDDGFCKIFFFFFFSLFFFRTEDSIEMSWFGLLKITLEISYRYLFRALLLYNPDFVILARGTNATRPAALSNFFTRMTQNSAGRFRVRSPMRRRVSVPERPKRH